MTRPAPTVALAMLALGLGLAVPAAAGPGAGTDLTPASDTWWIHADPDFGPWMSNVRDEGTDHYVGWGPSEPTVAPPGLGSSLTSFTLDPAPAADIHLDTAQAIALDVWVGGGMAGALFVSPALLVDGEVLASGEELSDAVAAGDLLHFTWTLTPLLEVIPAGSEVVWEFRLSGAYDEAYYWMEDGTWTSATLPVVAGPAGAGDAAAGAGSGSGSGSASASASSAASASSTSSRPASSSSTTSRDPSNSGLPASPSGSAGDSSSPAEGPSGSKDAPAGALALPALGGAALAARRRRR